MIRGSRRSSPFGRRLSRATGPAEDSGGDAGRADLVELVRLDPTIKLDIRYAGTNNFLGKPVYKEARAFLQRPAAEAVARAHRALRPHGYGLLIHDGYRPWAITKLFWDMTSGKQREFVADPKTGSKHNRGAAVDLTMYDLKTGAAVQMPGDYDEMTERSYPDYTGGTAEQRATPRSAAQGDGSAKASPSNRTSGGITITRTGANTRFSISPSAQSESRPPRRMEYVIDLFLHLDVHLAEFVAQYGVLVYAGFSRSFSPKPGSSSRRFCRAIRCCSPPARSRPPARWTLRWCRCLIAAAAVLGNAVNYAIGRAIGPRVFAAAGDVPSLQSKLLNRKHLDRGARILREARRAWR